MREDPEILLVEDDPTDVVVALRALRHAHLEKVCVVRDGDEAIQVLQLDGKDMTEGPRPPRPRVIFLDLKMPKVDGFELLREIRSAEHTRDIPVVVVSSSNREADVRTCYRLGANSFLVKRHDPSRPGGYLADAARYWLELNCAPHAKEPLS